MQLHGLHHLTAVSADAPGNHDFYTRVMGMRLVKKTVNQDDVSAYHLFYADGQATPGTDLTFFDWPTARERRGTHSIARTGLRVSGEKTLAWWQDHLKAAKATTGDIAEVAGYRSLDFEDHPFDPPRPAAPCALCGSRDSYLDEVVTDDRGGRRFLCSDTDYCAERRARQ